MAATLRQDTPLDTHNVWWFARSKNNSCSERCFLLNIKIKRKKLSALGAINAFYKHKNLGFFSFYAIHALMIDEWQTGTSRCVTEKMVKPRFNTIEAETTTVPPTGALFKKLFK